MTTQAKRKNIMREFSISEISAVDRPAQAHARALIMKRTGGEQQEHRMQFEKITRDEPLSFGSLDDAIDHLMDMRKCSRLAAMEAAARAQPELAEMVRRDGREAVAKAAQAAAEAARPRVTKAQLDFQERAEQIAKRNGIPLHAAMARARERFPDAFDAAYGRA